MNRRLFYPAAVAATATAGETAAFAEIVALAKAGKRECKVFSLTPAVQALLFVKCNGHAHGARDEFAFRLNDGNVKRHTLDRLDSLVRSTRGQRITYKELTA